MLKKAGQSLSRNFLLLWQGQLVSLLGTQVFRLALAVWLKEAVDSATLVGLLMATFVVPGLFIGPFGGVLVDRYPRRLVLVGCDLVQGAAVAAMGLVWFIVPTSHPVSVTGLFLLAFIMGSTSAVFQPAALAFVPELVPRESLPRANSLIQGSFQVGAVAAQSLAGISLRLIGAPILALLDSATYFYSAVSEWFITMPPAPQPSVARARANRSFGREARAALTYVRSNTGLFALLLVSAALKFFVAPFTVLLVFYVDGHLHASLDWYGFLIGGLSVGSIAGVVIGGAVKLSPRARGTAILATLVLQSLTLTSLALVSTPQAALVLVTSSGFLSGFLNVRLTTLLQLAVAVEMRGRVFGVLRTVTDGLVPVATILAGIGADLTGRNVAVVYAACGLALTFVSMMAAGNRPCRAFLRGEGAPTPAATGKEPAEPAAAAVVGV